MSASPPDAAVDPPPGLRVLSEEQRQCLEGVAAELADDVGGHRERRTAGVVGAASALARVGVDVGASLAGALAHRVTRGPLVEGWGVPEEVVHASVRGLMGAMATGMEVPQVNAVESIVDVATRILWPPPGYRAALRTVVERELPVDGDWIRPKAYSPRGVVLYLHGGGYLGGSPWTHRATTSRLAMRTNTAVLVPEYRLAPEHPFPAALEDALSCYVALLLRGVPPSSIIVAGDSAGGGLAASLGVALVARNLPQPAGYCLTSPEVDLTGGDAGSLTANVATDVLPHPIPTHGYVGDADPRDPLVSPSFASDDVLAELAPMLVQVGGREVMRDAQVRFAERVSTAGGVVWLHVEPSMFHVWPLLLPWRPEAHAAELRTCAFVEQHLGPLPLDGAPGLLAGSGSHGAGVAAETEAQRQAATDAAERLVVDEQARRRPFGDAGDTGD